jgi:RNA 2',3'-cyclic 3'-phosphodiesterase
MQGTYRIQNDNKPVVMKRIFIAVKINPEEALLQIYSSLQISLADETIKWVKPDNIHLTLAFPGDTDEKKIELISKMLREKCAGFGMFELIIRGAGVFKSMNSPRVIWTDIEPSIKLNQLYNLIIDGLHEIDVVIEDRPFKPHLTLGRIKSVKDKTLLKMAVERYQHTEIQRVRVTEIILYESILLQSGPLYKPLNKFSL